MIVPQPFVVRAEASDLEWRRLLADPSVTLQQAALCTASYIRSRLGVRARIVKGALESWRGLLSLPFAATLFLDDCSPGAGAIRLLACTSVAHCFTHVRYHTPPHPPHSNFGIVRSMSLCESPYIVHLDDDVQADGNPETCAAFLAECIGLLERDESILGLNVLTLCPDIHDPWQPGDRYREHDGFAHPRRYFGTAACVIRRELLARVGWGQIAEWGKRQPANWEELVSNSPREFLTARHRTPFWIDGEARLLTSTAAMNLSRWKAVLKSVARACAVPRMGETGERGRTSQFW